MSLSMGVSGDIGGNVANAAIGLGVGAMSVATGRVPASLRCIDPSGPPGFILFDFNPNNVLVSRSMDVKQRPQAGGLGGPGGATGPIAKQVNTPDITLTDIWFEGAMTKWRIDTLLHWMSPPTSSDPVTAGLAALGLPTQSLPPTVTFQWGPPLVGFMYDCKISSCSATYERFTPMGIPIRAKVTLKMSQQLSLLADLPTNPTSGGQPGRRSHVIKDGDTLQSVATTHYGRPQMWRRIAAVNRIDNPMRLQPGRRVYLPNAGELEGMA